MAETHALEAGMQTTPRNSRSADATLLTAVEVGAIKQARQLARSRSLAFGQASGQGVLICSFFVLSYKLGCV